MLDARFGLHQRAGVVLARFFEGVVEIEKEVGVMRNAGEALSIGWYVNYSYGERSGRAEADGRSAHGREATVKGIIGEPAPPPSVSRGTT